MTAQQLAGFSVGFVAPEDAGAVRELERLGVDSLWVGGHVASVNPSPEPVAWLARLVEQTRIATIGTAALLPSLYPPALLAKQLADLDRHSGGRLTLGVGVGGEYDSDFAAVGVPRAERAARTDETIDLLRRFWTGEPVTWSGRHFQLDGIRIHPAPAQPGGPAIVVCGRGLPAMRRAVRTGNGWMPYLYSARRYRESVEQITELAAAAGRDLRDFGWYVYLMVVLDDDARIARRRAVDMLGATYRQDVDAMVDRIAVTGDTDMVTARIQEYLDAGADHVVVCPIGGDVAETAFRLCSDILPQLNNKARSSR